MEVVGRVGVIGEEFNGMGGEGFGGIGKEDLQPLLFAYLRNDQVWVGDV